MNITAILRYNGTLSTLLVLFLSQLYLLFIYASKYFLIDHHCKSQTEFSDHLGKRQNLLMFPQGALPELRTLILNGCKLTSDDLQSFAKVNQNDVLPKLTHLDITGNTDSITSLFHDSCTWDKLLKFKMSNHLTQDPNAKRDKKQNNLEPESIAFL